MYKLLEVALDAAKSAGAGYADGRLILRRSQSVAVKNSAIDALAEDSEQGFGIRVLADGAWGFAASRSLTEAEAARVGREAVAIAKASARFKDKDVVLSPREPAVAEWTAPCKIDPFTVPIKQKVELLMETDSKMVGIEKVVVRECSVDAYRYEQWYADTDGARIHQTKVESGSDVNAIAADGGEMQNRNYPEDWKQAGWEYIEKVDLPGNAERVAREAAELLTAQHCPADVRTLIIKGPMLALQLHESCGHPIELDRVLGMEASYAGTSFLTPEKLDNFTYGSPHVNIVADATTPGGLGTFAYDDEGIPSQCTKIVDKGQFVGYLSSRETAPVIGRTSSGAMRGDGWNRLPIIRMTNINLLPGDSSLDELIKGTEKGLVVEGVKSWSIDDRRLNFQFACQYGRLIENGELGAVVKDSTYTGRTPDFWGNCDGVAGPSEWRIWGVPNCGKGEPGQTGHVGHGVSHARFRNVRVGVTEEKR